MRSNRSGRGKVHSARADLRIVSRGVSELLAALVLYFSRIVPKERGLWCFGAWHGERFADNPRYLFEWIREHSDPSVTAVWLTRRRAVRSAVRSHGAPAFLWYERRGIVSAMRASVFLFSHTPGDISPIAGRGAMLVQLTHGTPLKQLGGDAAFGRTPVALRRLLHLRSRLTLAAPGHWHLVAAASEEGVRRWRAAWPSVPPHRIVATGYPRWIPFSENAAAGRRLINELGDLGTAIVSGGRRVLLYAPTLRAFGEMEFHYAQIPGFAAFTTAAIEEGYILLLRQHPAALKVDDGRATWIPVDDDVLADVGDLLPFVDVLVTDYSSLIYDVGIHGRTVILLASDLDSYSSDDVGFGVDYLSEGVGPVCQDWAEVLERLTAGRGEVLPCARFIERHGGLALGDACQEIVDLILSAKDDHQSIGAGAEGS